MQLLGAISLAITAIIVLGLLRSRLLFEFTAFSMLLFDNNLIGKWLYSLFFLPGTILHELSHWLVAELLGVGTGKIEIIPDFEKPLSDNRELLGSVQTVRTGPIRSFLIGAAPFFTGVATLFVLGTLLLQGGWLWWQYFLIIYGIIVIGSSMLLSKEDRRSWPFIAVLVALILIFYVISPLKLSSNVLEFLLSIIAKLNQALFVTVLSILAIIGISYVLRRIIEKILGKKVIRR